MNKIFLSIDARDDKTAGLKARVDVLNILKRNGYTPVHFTSFSGLSQLLKFWKSLSDSVSSGGHIVVEYPCWSRKRLYVVALFCMIKKVKLYGVIHDIASIREQSDPSKDIAILKLFHGIISHNAEMTKWLRENRVHKKVVNLNVFDYCLEEDFSYHTDTVGLPLKIMYAGNLSHKKATYIYDDKLGSYKNFELCLYGQYLEAEKMKCSRTISYKGAFNPDNPRLEENYHFGLIWEGTSLQTCEGSFGNYIRYNNPHKFSLYIALGLPVIVWKEAAIASLVTKHNIGFTISDFDELEAISKNITNLTYSEYVQNVDKIAEKVRSGLFLETAIGELVKS